MAENIKILENENRIELNDGTYILKNCKNVILSGNVVVRELINSEVNKMKDNSNISIMCENSEVETMYDNSEIFDMEDNSKVGSMYDNSEVYGMRGNSQVRYMYEDSQIGEMYEDSQICEMFDNSKIYKMYDNSKISVMFQNSKVDTMRNNSKVELMCDNSKVINDSRKGGKLNMKMTIKEFFESKELLAIHTPTIEQAIKLLKAVYKQGYEWCGGESYLDNNYWFIFKENTYYSNDGYYGSIKLNEKDNITLKVEDIIFEEEDEKPMKNYIEEVAKMLGVEIGEKFNVINHYGDICKCNPYHFTKDNLFGCDGEVIDGNLERLLRCDLTIQKLPKYHCDICNNGIYDEDFHGLSNTDIKLCGCCFNLLYVENVIGRCDICGIDASMLNLKRNLNGEHVCSDCLNKDSVLIDNSYKWKHAHYYE